MKHSIEARWSASALLNDLALTSMTSRRGGVKPLLTGFIITWTALTLSLVLFGARETHTTVAFEIAIREPAPKTSGLLPCFYYDTGKGFSEDEKTCFAYDRKPIDSFQAYTVTLPTSATVRALRFDPMAEPGLVAIRRLAFTGYRHADIAFPQELGRTVYSINQATLSADGDTLVARLRTDDPSIMLSDALARQVGIDRWWILGRLGVALLICLGLIAGWFFLRLLRVAASRIAEIPALMRRALVWSWHRTASIASSMRAVTLATLTVFIVAMAITKVFAVVTSAFRYARPISFGELLAAPAQEIVIGALALLMVVGIVGVDKFSKGRRFAAPIRALLFGLEVLLSLAFASLAIFEILSCYVFWEWGAFVDGSLLKVAYECPSPESMRYYLTRAPAALAALAMVALAGFGVVAFSRFKRGEISRRVVLGSVAVAALWAMAAAKTFNKPDAYDPSISSPIVLAMQTAPHTTAGLDSEAVPANLNAFQLPPAHPIPSSYQHYRGAAAGQDVIFVVLESVRRENLSLYGYPRKTTPNLDRLSQHAMVFSNAYVSQPRSCKTLESFTLGTYPDPRIEAVTWNPERILGRPNLWGILTHDGYRGYLGINADLQSDGFAPFMQTAMGPGLERTVGLIDLIHRYGALARAPGTDGNDTLMIDDFLQWYRAKTTPAAAMIWFSAAHHPYWATTRKFPEKNIIDQYDNCIYSSDEAVGHLIDEIEKTGRHPLILIMGDHGEAFGEHAGDQLHGVYLYNESMRIPMMLYNSAVFAQRQDFGGRFSVKDIPSTILYLLGRDQNIGQSEVIFSKQPDDPIYMSNIYGDFKLGEVSGSGPDKFMYLPGKKQAYLFDVSADPKELTNLAPTRSPEEIARREQELLGWYFFQVHYLDQMFPHRSAVEQASSAGK